MGLGPIICYLLPFLFAQGANKNLLQQGALRSELMIISAPNIGRSPIFSAALIIQGNPLYGAQPHIMLLRQLKELLRNSIWKSKYCCAIFTCAWNIIAQQ